MTMYCPRTAGGRRIRPGTYRPRQFCPLPGSAPVKEVDQNDNACRSAPLAGLARNCPELVRYDERHAKTDSTSPGRGAAGSSGYREPPANPQPGIKLSADQLKAQIHVTAGRRLRPQSWPNGARVAVALSFDVDNMSASLARGDLAPGVLSRGEYGAVDGLPRILRLLDSTRFPPRSSSRR